MNILFVTIDGDPLYAGGTATIVQMMAGWLEKHSHYCAIGFFQEREHPSTYFKDRIHLIKENMEAIKRLNNKHPFDLLYITQCIGIDWCLLHECFPKAKLIAAYHNRPMLMCPPKIELLKLAKSSRILKEKMKLYLYYTLYPLYKVCVKSKERKSFVEIVRYADKIQLLSEGFRPVFKQIIPYICDGQIICIGNPVVWKLKASMEMIDNKRREVLVVCNANHQKRAHLMIEIWRRLETDPQLTGWFFTFVGDSSEVQRLKKKAFDEYHLQRIRFEGRQKPDCYYECASILLMTSGFEGWPMVLMEAMPMGVVPIAFNSFESLQDIISHKENGIIIPNNDMDKYVAGLKWLMTHPGELRDMAVKATKIVDKYSLDSIMEKYSNFFYSLVQGK